MGQKVSHDTQISNLKALISESVELRNATDPNQGPSPEEGVRLICAFIRIKQPELRAAIVKLATQMADVKALTTPVQN
jgi:hypothetical protein